MLDRLIARTNKPDFTSRGRILLLDFKGEIDRLDKRMEFNFIVDEEDYDGKILDVENWQLIAEGFIETNRMFFRLKRPYCKIKLLNDHPLLWKYNKPKLICELTNYPKNPSEFLGDMFLEFENKAGNWIPVNEHFWNIHMSFKRKGKTTVGIPEPLEKSIEKVCIKHDVQFEVVEIEERGIDRPKAKLLLFGNEVVTPDYFNLRQPYIVADNFVARLGNV